MHTNFAFKSKSLKAKLGSKSDLGTKFLFCQTELFQWVGPHEFWCAGSSSKIAAI